MENIYVPKIGHFYSYDHSDFSNLAMCYRVEKDFYYFIEHDNGGDSTLWFDKVSKRRFEDIFTEEKDSDCINYWLMDCFRQGLVWLFTERRFHTVGYENITEKDIQEVETAVKIFNEESGIEDKLGQYKLNYADYLKTPHWKKARDLKLRQSEHKCQLCGSKYRLEVHHNCYDHLWLEEMYPNDLVVLCHRCHSKFHDKK